MPYFFREKRLFISFPILTNSFLCLFLFITALGLLSCNQEKEIAIADLLIGEIEVQLNPGGKAPLAALSNFFTKKSVKVDMQVLGDIPINKAFPDFTKKHAIPVLGLYPGQLNKVVLTLTDEKNRYAIDTLLIQTDSLPFHFPTIEITKLDTAKMEPGFHLFEFLNANNGYFDTYSIMFDNQGAVRWYFDMSATSKMSFTNLRLKNGNWCYASWLDLFEFDLVGRRVKEWKLGGFAGDHDMFELPNGNLLMGASKRATTILKEGKQVKSRYDHVVELKEGDRTVVREWDMRKHFDVDRNVLEDKRVQHAEADWFHINSFWYDEKEASLLVSGRNQGIAKVDMDNNLQWILAPHYQWGKAGPNGEGVDVNNDLLTAIDENGQPYKDSVQLGVIPAADFEWTYGQHNPMLLPNGNVFVMDNGYLRNFQPAPFYSRAVEYKIDASAKTIQQVWQYGKERGTETYSAITSDVDLLPQTNNRLITLGNIRLSQDKPNAKIIEVTYPAGEVVFEAKMLLKDARGPMENAWGKFDVVYRGERYDLYPEKYHLY